MEELIFTLETYLKIKHAVSSTYTATTESADYHACMELLNELLISIVNEQKQHLDS